MADAALTSKGQITIPAEIRKQMDLQPKDKVVFTVLPNGTTVMRAKKRAIAELAGSVKPAHKRKVKTEDMRPK